MMTTIDSIGPRSILHALPATGQGTGQVESLTSYFCRLAHSHGMSAMQLACWMLKRKGQPVPSDYRWHLRNFVSVGIETEQWAASLSELTGIGNLDQLSLAPWRRLISVPGLVPKTDRWCPLCLAEDLSTGRDPYLRLSWDVAAVTACSVHKVALVHTCPHCQKSNVRNRASVVLPGYCTACGGFLGAGTSAPAKPEHLWVGRQIGLMLSHPPTLDEEGSLADFLREVIARMDGGNVAQFARRLGLSKSGVWYWINQCGSPTLAAWLAISLHGNIALNQLLRLDIEGWTPPVEPPQLELDLPSAPRKGMSSRTLDWDAITQQLREILREDVPISLEAASARVGLHSKQLNLRATTEARAIADRFRRYRAYQKQEKEEALKRQINGVLASRIAAGFDGISVRNLRPVIAGTSMGNVRHAFSLIKQVREGTE